MEKREEERVRDYRYDKSQQGEYFHFWYGGGVHRGFLSECRCILSKSFFFKINLP
jgi:hypothetical protein